MDAVEGEREKEPFDEVAAPAAFGDVPAATPPPHPARARSAGSNTAGTTRSAMR
jgi:hypothetical protein